MNRRSVGRSIALMWIATWVVGCSADVSPSVDTQPSGSFDQTGILLVDAAEQVQAMPPTEVLRLAFSQATEFAEANGKDLGFPWFDPSRGELVLSIATSHGRDLLVAANIAVPHRIRDVAHGVAELERIQHEATLLHSQGVPGADLIYATLPDHRDNRILIVITSMNRALLDSLAERFPVDTIAVQVNPSGIG
jgi:hypothetical protein